MQAIGGTAAVAPGRPDGAPEPPPLVSPVPQAAGAAAGADVGAAAGADAGAVAVVAANTARAASARRNSSLVDRGPVPAAKALRPDGTRAAVGGVAAGLEAAAIKAAMPLAVLAWAKPPCKRGRTMPLGRSDDSSSSCGLGAKRSSPPSFEPIGGGARGAVTPGLAGPPPEKVARRSKSLAEERANRAVLEAAVPNGEVLSVAESGAVLVVERVLNCAVLDERTLRSPRTLRLPWLILSMSFSCA